jgi:hypothetical protein
MTFRETKEETMSRLFLNIPAVLVALGLVGGCAAGGGTALFDNHCDGSGIIHNEAHCAGPGEIARPIDEPFDDMED